MKPLDRLQTFSWFVLLLAVSSVANAELRVGAAKVDISPEQFPVLVNGSMTSRNAEQITTRIHARAIVLDDGNERIGIVVVDSCMVPKHLCDEAKQLAASRTNIRSDHMLISATHTHTAPSSMGALGTDADPNYVPFLRQKIAEAFVEAESRLEPAKVGWGSGQAPNFTALRRWVRRPDRLANDPFGNPTVRATMHAARNPEDAIGPTGPEDPELSLIAFQDLEGNPIAVLTNFSMHYFGGEKAISADYFGYFCTKFEEFLSGTEDSEVVAAMSHGCSGDIWRRDYMTPRPEADGTMQEFSLGLLEVAKVAYSQVNYQADAALEMRETRLQLDYRVPNQQRLTWAKQVVAEMGDRLPKTQPEIYAREQIFLDQMQSTEIVAQALRIGDISIATTPNETYALTGLKLKEQSPFTKTMVIELANGGDGYIPPPEQHFLGGYNTWAARSAGLEETAEPKIVAANLRMLEEIAEAPRRTFTQSEGAAAQQIQQANPIAYWRMHEFGPPLAIDTSGYQRHAHYEQGVVFFLEGVDSATFVGESETNRCAHFAGGRMRAKLHELGDASSAVFACWNGMPLDARDISGWMMSNDHEYSLSDDGLHVGLDRHGRVVARAGSETLTGKTAIPRWTWARIAVVRSASAVQIYVNGQLEIEAARERKAIGCSSWFFGGRSDNQDNWEGKLDEIAVFDRALTTSEAKALSSTESSDLDGE